MGQQDGVIKFSCDWKRTEPFISVSLKELIRIRKLLFDRRFIGSYPSGIGYGNISCRELGNTFFISGSSTGNVEDFSNEHISLVVDFNLEANHLTCQGPGKASSESMSHAIIYKTLPNIKGVIHIHNRPLWSKYLNKLPTTNPSVGYGTPSMAKEIERLLNREEGVIIMGGHEEGILAYGNTLVNAYDLLDQLN